MACNPQVLLSTTQCLSTLPPFILLTLQNELICSILSRAIPVPSGGTINNPGVGFWHNPEAGGGTISNPEA